VFKKIIDYFIYKGDKLEIVTYRKSKFFVLSLLVFVIVNSLFFFMIFQNIKDADKERMLITAVIVNIFMFIPLFVYKYIGKRLLILNIFIVIAYGGVYDTYKYAGGIYSHDLLWYVIVLPAWITISGNKKSGLFWFLLSIIYVSFLTYADYNAFEKFKELTADIKSHIILFNLIAAGVLTMSFIFIYENNNEKYNKEIITAKQDIENKSKELEIKNEDIISSINYAQKIQLAVLPQEDTIQRNIPLSFIYFKPKDIVSGDFFWFHEIDIDNYIIVCADCTGHGVPGAFMTVIGSNILSQIVLDNKIINPAEILKELDVRMTRTLKQEKEHFKIIHDGMDLALLKVNKKDKNFVFSSAKRSALFIKNKQLQEFKGSKNTIGGLRSGEKKFDEIVLNYEEGDMIYMFTDGYIDQFGGSENKKFMIKRFRELLFSIYQLPVIEQRNSVEKTMDNWIGKNDQTDDILVMGIKF